MAIDRPAILISPFELEVEPEQIQALSTAMFNAQPGQVIHSAFPVHIHHLIDGLWIESSDLHQVLVKSNPEDSGIE